MPIGRKPRNQPRILISRIHHSVNQLTGAQEHSYYGSSIGRAEFASVGWCVEGFGEEGLVQF